MGYYLPEPPLDSHLGLGGLLDRMQPIRTGALKQSNPSGKTNNDCIAECFFGCGDWDVIKQIQVEDHCRDFACNGLSHRPSPQRACVSVKCMCNTHMHISWLYIFVRWLCCGLHACGGWLSWRPQCSTSLWPLWVKSQRKPTCLERTKMWRLQEQKKQHETWRANPLKTHLLSTKSSTHGTVANCYWVTLTFMLF